jgi:hypothetical protein
MTTRTDDGSWSAWDDLHTIDLHILTVGGDKGGQPVEADAMLGQAPAMSGSGWVGFVDERSDPDERGPAYQFAIAAAARNNLISCWVSYRDAQERSWAEKVLKGLSFVESKP